MKENWIKISDYLPELEVDVLLCEITKDKIYLYDIGYLDTITTTKRSKSLSWQNKDYNFYIDPTHWQPLEEPDEENN